MFTRDRASRTEQLHVALVFECNRSDLVSLHASWGLVHKTTEKLENAVLFLHLGPPSTLIRHWRKRRFRKTLFQREEFENNGFAF